MIYLSVGEWLAIYDYCNYIITNSVWDFKDWCCDLQMKYLGETVLLYISPGCLKF